MGKFKEPSNIDPEELLPSLLRSNMLRMVLTKHIELNKSAETKASMLLTAASIVIAVLVSTKTGEVNPSSHTILLGTSLLAIFSCIMVILPRPYHRNSKRTNLLYFRSFKQMTEDEYVEAMKEMMSDKNKMYDQYIRDIYGYGNITLTRKYRWLTAGLVLFLIGLLMGGLEWKGLLTQ